ncbi:MAG: TIGR03790 family protein [Verrucomicrobiota bacterium]
MRFLFNCRRWIALAFMAAAIAAGSCEEPGSQVIVVYNSRAPESRSLAEYYAQRRHVPTNQVFGFALPTTPEISRSEFHDNLQRPLAQLLEDRKLWQVGSETVRDTNNKPHVVFKVTRSKIRYAVLCYGVPFKINRDPSVKEPIEESLRPEFRRNEAAVDSELALLPLFDQHLPITGFIPSPVYSATNADFLSPTNGVLLVTRLDGPTADTARGLVDKALLAEANGLWGRAYFDLRGIQDPGYKMGDDWLRDGAEICRHLGFETIVDERPETFPAEFPLSQVAIYCGWYDGNVSGPFTRTEVEFMPGAFAYHLHSYSAANLRSTTQNWVGPLLAKGATASMGCVDEPYLSGTPQIAIFLARFLYFNMTFGEAAYACQPLLSWQTTVVGDPLYRPNARPPQELHDELVRRKSPWAQWSFLRVANLNLARGVSPAVMADFLEQAEISRTSPVLSEKLADLCEQIGKPSSAIELDERALKLEPTPQQKVRIRLTLAQRLADAGRNQEAYDDLLKLLQENPDYPNRLDIYHRLLNLARHLNHTEDAARYEGLIKSLTPPPAETNSPKR